MALLAELPALPLHAAGKYVAAAYVVLFAMVLVYVAIMAIRASRTERRLGELLEQLDRSDVELQASVRMQAERGPQPSPAGLGAPGADGADA